jgi:hypothetical protein
LHKLRPKSSVIPDLFRFRLQLTSAASAEDDIYWQNLTI